MLDYPSLVAKMREFEKLPHGWHYGQGEPADPKASANAIVLAFVLNGVGVDGFGAFPGDGGEVSLVAYRGDETCEIDCRETGVYSFFLEANSEVIHEGSDLSFEELIVELGAKGWRSPRLFGSCTQSVLMRSSSDLIAQPSRIHQVVASRSFPMIVSRVRAIQSVSTSGNFTTSQSPETHQSSGNFQWINWVQMHA